MTKKKPLDGIRVLDFTHAAAGPFATLFLADLGAEVVKIEKPGAGDGARSMGVPYPGQERSNSDYYLALNRNKKSVTLDLSRPEGVAIAKAIAARSDIVVQNFRPGVLDRLGLGFDDLRVLRRGLVFCSITAFGATGPLADQPANDIIMQSVSGLMGITGEVGGGPVRIGAPISDYSSGLFAITGILAALFARDAHPDGQQIDISMLEASLNMMANYIPAVAGLGHPVPRLGRGHAQIVPYQAFLCSDGEYLMVGAFTRGFWQNLARAVGHEEWIADPRFSGNAARLRNRAELVGLLEAIFGTRTRDDWLAVLQQADVPCSPVYELHDAVRQEQVRHSGAIVTADGTGVPMARFPVRAAAWGEDRLGRAPDLGEDTEAVLAELLGWDGTRIAAARAAGALG